MDDLDFDAMPLKHTQRGSKHFSDCTVSIIKNGELLSFTFRSKDFIEYHGGDNIYFSPSKDHKRLYVISNERGYAVFNSRSTNNVYTKIHYIESFKDFVGELNIAYDPYLNLFYLEKKEGGKEYAKA